MKRPRHPRLRPRMQESQIVYRGRIFRVRRDVVVEPPLLRRRSGPETRPRSVVVREIVEHGGSVVLLPVFPDGRILLVQQYRHAVGDFLWELVAGGIEPGESPLQAARRELEEETGYRAGRFERLAEFYPTPGFASEKMILYRATGLKPGHPRPETDEALEARRFSLVQLTRMIRRGTLRDGKSLVGILLHASGRGRRR